LRLQELLQPTAQQWPISLLEGEMPAEILQGDLAHLAANAFTAHQAIGVIPLARGFVVSAGLSNKHALNATGKARFLGVPENPFMAAQNDNRKSFKINIYNNQCVMNFLSKILEEMWHFKVKVRIQSG